MKDQIEDIKKEFEAAGASVTQVEPHEYRPVLIKFKDREEQERIEAAMRDRDTVVLVNGHPEGGTAEERPKEIGEAALQMLNDFINGR